MRSVGTPADKILHCFAKGGNPAYVSIIHEAVIACELDIAANGERSVAKLIDALHHCAAYYENIGCFDKALTVSLKNLEYAAKYGDDYLTRRAHSIVGGAYMRMCNFQLAFVHAQKAYDIAVKNEDIVARFMALLNTCAILTTMGLLSDAQKLSLRLAKEQPFGTGKLDTLHLANSSNGMRLSHVLNDAIAARVFYKVAVRSAKSDCEYITQCNRVHYEAARIVQIALQGETDVAIAAAAEALATARMIGNVNWIALMLCAQAECYLIIADVESIVESQISLEQFVREFVGMVDLYQGIVTVLLKIDSFLVVALPQTYRSRVQAYEQLQRSHSLGVTHKEFFGRVIAANGDADINGFVLENPSYEIPDWVKEIFLDGGSKAKIIRVHNGGKRSPEKIIPDDISWLSRQFGAPHGSTFIDTVQNWAIAAECAFGGDGYNCVRVGRLAAEIARARGYSDESAETIELASRLHDIGKIVLAFSAEKHENWKAFGRLSPFGRHAIIGARLLDSSNDKTLILAGSIALSHHEWWNGCGYPVGIKGLDIPVEARICAIADFIVSQVFPRDGRQSWSVGSAIMQTETMAGIQFDPEICALLRELFAFRGNELWSNNLVRPVFEL